MVTWLLRVLPGTLLLYGLYGAYYFFAQTGMIFPAEDAHIPDGLADRYPNRYEFWIPAEGGEVEAWYLPPTHLDRATADSTAAADTPPGTDLRRAVPIPGWAVADSVPAWAPAALMVVCHGNADVIDDWLPNVELVRTAGIGVLLVEYPGYGRSPGTPSQNGITALQLAGMDTVIARGWVDPDRLVYAGHSLGGGVACQIARFFPPQAMILISTFTSVRSFAADYFLPGFLVQHPFDNLAVLADYEGQVLVVHAEDDEKVPYEHGVALYDAAAGGWFASRDRGGHNTLDGAWPVFWSTTGLPFLADAWRVAPPADPPPFSDPPAD